MIPPKYLGDAVYASFDGYHIHLAVGNHHNKVVALEPEVMNSLIEYYKKTQEKDNSLKKT